MDKRNEYAYFNALLDNEHISVSAKYDAPASGRKRHAVPVKELDLHRKNSSQAREAVIALLNSAKADRTEKLIIHCGKGMHSENGPVLQNVVAELLEQRKGRIKSYRMDQNGTFEVKLK